MEQLVELYKAMGESDKIAKRHAQSAYALQNPEKLMHSYAEGSKIKARTTAKAYNNLR